MTEPGGDGTGPGPAESSLMAELSRVITDSPQIEDVYARFAELVKPLLPFDRIDIVSIDRDEGILRAEFVYGVELDDETARRGYSRRLAGSIAEAVAETGSGVLFSPDAETVIAEEFPRHVDTHGQGVRSSMSAPLISGGKVVGMLTLMSLAAGAYTDENLRTAARIALQISGAVANARLLAKQREIEDALRSREQRYWEMYEEAPIAYVSSDYDGLIVGANRRAREMFGYTSEEMIGRPVRDLFADTPPGLGRTPYLNEQFRARKEVRGGELELTTAGGSNFWGSVSAYFDEGLDGEVGTYRSTIQDISEHKHAEDELRRVHALYRLLADSLQDMVALKDASGRFLLVNQAFADRIGIPKEEIEGKFWEEFILDPEVSRAARGKHEEVVRTGEGAESEMTYDFGGGPRTLLDRTIPILDSEGRVERVLSTATDITERRRTEDALRQSEVNYRTLIENMDAVVALKDADGRYVVVNEAFSAVAGLPQEEIIGKTAADIYDDPVQVAHIEKHDREVLQSRKPMQFQVWSGDDKIMHKAPVLDGEGNVTGIVSVIFDVTQLRYVEDELRKTDEMYRLLVDSLQDTISLKDASGRFLLVNQAFARQSGLPREEIEGRMREDFYDDIGVAEVARQHHEEVLRTAKGSESEISADFGDGLRVYYSRDTPILDQDGRVARIVSVAQDITERKRLESELRQSQKMQVVGQLAGGIAHDFNNLLTVISAYAAMSKQALSSDHTAASFQRGILDAVDRAAELIRQLLLFSRSETSNLEVVDVNSLIIGGADMLRRLIGTNIDLVMVPAQAPLLIEVDPSQFEQVLVNLAVNARDAMPGGGKLTVALGPHTIDNHVDDPVLPLGRYVKLSVSDDGIGMADEVRSRVFEPFFTTKETGKGSGLGLSTCFGITKQNGGNIQVTTALGVGTTFDVYLPITDKPAALSADAHPASEPPAGKETILLAEDESIVRDIVETALRDQGYTVVAASNGEEALRAAEAHDGKIHMVLTDMVMPRMGGTELVRRVQERWPGFPVLLMSGYTGEERLSGSTPLLNKPFVIGEMLTKIRQVLDDAGESFNT